MKNKLNDLIQRGKKLRERLGVIIKSPLPNLDHFFKQDYVAWNEDCYKFFKTNKPENQYLFLTDDPRKIKNRQDFITVIGNGSYAINVGPTNDKAEALDLFKHLNLQLQELKKYEEEHIRKQLVDKLQSIDLVTSSVAVGSVIFMVLDERFNYPIRFATVNRQNKDTAIKKLHDIAYIKNVPGKKVTYEKKLADNINNGLFRKTEVAKYIKTNGFRKPTLVNKSRDGLLVLKSEIPIKTMLLNQVPSQRQSLHEDITR